MQKKRYLDISFNKILLIFSILIIAINLINSAYTVSVPTSNYAPTKSFDFSIKFIEDFINSWQSGQGIDLVVVKWLFLILIAALIFSILTNLSFPENSFIRIITSIIISFLATFLITPDELFGILISYSALGITISLFFVIAILLFLTIVTAKVANPIGIFFTRILWLIYSIYITLKGLLVILLKTGIENYESITYNLGSEIDWGSSILSSWVQPILKLISNETFSQALKTSTLVAIVMIAIGIGTFYMGVINKRWIDEWVAKGMTEARVSAYESKLRAQNAKMNADVKAFEEGSTTVK